MKIYLLILVVLLTTSCVSKSVYLKTKCSEYPSETKNSYEWIDDCNNYILYNKK